ncbi:S8 family peptidase [Halalkalibacter alkaliphilus]|uniref:S8 family peptidase n=1 Tax=Halalkalibacter alkaliphilus TaxID=2917993 RepID=A0A9X2CQC4_9BACI|nr:S8 family peptidase [Halalkalibacter alkaliphilus]MCL7745661.1 S8 family peptidase [Halalkalibacter alkaliphilus]
MKNTKVIPPGIELIEAPSVWEQGYSGEGIVIAVLDTGCDSDHFELKDQIIDGYNFTTDDNGDRTIFEDYNGHGTHVCGTICAAKNDEGVIGVAPKARLLVLKVLSGQGYGDTKWVTEGVRHAKNWRGENGERVRVISMSLGGRENNPELHQAIQEAIQQDILVVCAAGNEGDGKDETDEYAYPGAFPEVVQVGSVNLRGEISKFSNTNCKIDLVAPGEEILSTYLNNEFAVLSGTSMAAPHISGAAALIIEQSEKEFDCLLSEPELYAQLIKRTVSLNYSRRFQGNGILKLASSLVTAKEDHKITAAK